MRIIKAKFCQCRSCHATPQDGVLPGRSNRQQSPAGPVNMRRNMRRSIGAVYNGSCKPQSCQKQKKNYSTGFSTIDAMVAKLLTMWLYWSIPSIEEEMSEILLYGCVCWLLTLMEQFMGTK